MRKINKSPPPNSLTRYFWDRRNATWDNFRDYNSGDSYREIKNLIFNDQNFLCAYCEMDLKAFSQMRQCIEHFHPKRDRKKTVNWGLAWHNLLGVCTGGSDQAKFDGSKKYPPRRNLSCDSHKEKILKNNNPEGNILSPLEIIEYPTLFKFNKAEGHLEPCPDGCGEYTPKLNNFGSTLELVKNTIRVLNLNCDRLSDRRKDILDDYVARMVYARKNGDRSVKENLAEEWFGNKVMGFFTTRRLLLGDEAEKVIKRLSSKAFPEK